MKLQFPKIDTETSRAFESENFSLGDPRVLMSLLSDKIYARPKYIIVQEVASNARDANREVGRESTPIQIKMPSRLDDNIIIADSGPGISPKRMSDVFLKYGESTKRADNFLTGGFGIGAKTPFTYTDTFNVVTITDDDDGIRRERTYIAHKASNGFAKMSLVSTVETKEETGTAISFAVAKNDFSDFETAVREVCRYWKVRPIITGTPNWKWPEEKAIHKGKGWELVEAHSYNAASKVMIDGIPYSLRMETVFGNNRHDEAYRVLANTSARMYFEVGEISVTATREDLDYTDKTIKAIKQRASELLDELRAKVAKSVAGAKSLWEASIQWHNNSHQYRSFLVEPKWNGKSLLERSYDATGSFPTSKIKGYNGKENYIYLRDAVKVTSFHKLHDGTIESRKSYGRQVDRRIRVEDGVMLVEDDEKKARPNRLRLQTIFDANPNIKTVCLLEFKTNDGRLWAESYLQWNELPTFKFSAFPKAKNARTQSGQKRTINAVKVLTNSNNPNGWTKQWAPDNTRTPEDTQGGIYVLLKNGQPVKPDGTTSSISKDRYEQIMRVAAGGQKMYGILYKYRNKISSSWTNYLDNANNELKKLKAAPGVNTYLKYGNTQPDAGLGNSVHKAIKNSAKEIKDNSLNDFLAKAELASKSAGDYNRYVELANLLGEPTDSPKNEFKKLRDDVIKNYPLLDGFQRVYDGRSYYGTTNNLQVAKITKELIFYLNAKYDAAQSAQGVNNANP